MRGISASGKHGVKGEFASTREQVKPGIKARLWAVCVCTFLTIVSWVEEVFSQVTAEHPLPEDASLLQLLLGGPGLHEGAQEGDQLPVLLRHWGMKEKGGRRKEHVLDFPHDCLLLYSKCGFDTGSAFTKRSVCALEWNPIRGLSPLCVWASF